jgi:hypothetical protein
MKHVLVVLAIVAASVSCSSTVLSEDRTMGRPDEYGQFKTYEMKSMKDECLVVAKNCIGSSESVMQRAERLKKEIDKGTAIYTPDELKSFRDQLNWINSESDTFSGGGS